VAHSDVGDSPPSERVAARRSKEDLANRGMRFVNEPPGQIRTHGIIQFKGKLACFWDEHHSFPVDPVTV